MLIVVESGFATVRPWQPKKRENSKIKKRFPIDPPEAEGMTGTEFKSEN